METRASGPYRGYDVVYSERPSEFTEVGKGTPVGEYLRRFWQPVALSKDIESGQRLIKVLGEELVVFRDHSGDIGLLHKQCPHRGASLEFGLIVEHGIRCAYHGWHFAVDGRILEAPAEAKPGAIARALCQGAYPTLERDGIIFAYLGPPQERPDFPIYDFMVAEGEVRVPYVQEIPASWIHVRENVQDPVHASFLHSMFEVQQFGDFAEELPLIDAFKTPIGQITASVRLYDDRLYFRTNELIMPNLARLPDIPAVGAAITANLACDPTAAPRAGPLTYARKIPASHALGVTQYVLPRDDTSCAFIGWHHYPANASAEEIRVGEAMMDFGQRGDRPYEEAQKNPGDWEVLVSSGPVYKPDNEVLTKADVGVLLYRRQLQAEIDAMRAGKAVGRLASNEPIKTFAYTLFTPPTSAVAGEQGADLKAAFLKASVASVLRQEPELTPLILEEA
jgi:nitrite reductase/ring-hydroxylating ferredoxin subunit